MTEFCCPVCGGTLTDVGKSLRCPAGHCFDKARSGYVNLLLGGGSGRHGDDRLMVEARTAFLDAGYYAPLASCVEEFVRSFADPDSVLVDAGCGEGYYSARLHSVTGAQVIGIDISKQALMAASRRCRELSLAVGSTAAMPLADGCADAVINIFSPLFLQEFRRILRPDGYLVRVVPMEKHLWELKQAVYDRPYENEPPQTALEGFRLLRTQALRYSVTLPDNASIRRLFMMTPYYYKTGEKDQQKLDALQTLTTAAEFCVCLYQKL